MGDVIEEETRWIVVTVRSRTSRCENSVRDRRSRGTRTRKPRSTNCVVG